MYHILNNNFWHRDILVIEFFRRGFSEYHSEYLYTSTNGQARKFAEEMVERNIVKAIRAEEGNEKYDYYFPLEDPESLY